MITKLIAILLCTTAYTIVRYVIFGHVSPIHMPVYLLNKSVSMASMFFLFLAAMPLAKERTEETRFWGIASFHFACLHILLSLAILSSAYYPKFFGTDKMNLTGEVTVLFGILTAYCYWFARNGKSFFIRRWVIQLLAGIFVAGHLVAMGFGGWLEVEKWHGGLPPISLISFIFAMISLGLFLKTRKDK